MNDSFISILGNLPVTVFEKNKTENKKKERKIKNLIRTGTWYRGMSTNGTASAEASGKVV